MSTQASADRLLNRVDAVLFDLDGTLLDTARDLVAALVCVCAENNAPAPDPALAARYVSTGAVGLINLAFPDADAVTTERLRQRLVDVYSADLCSQTVPYPGIAAVLDTLDARALRWGVVTNKYEHLAVRILDSLGLGARCATVVGGDTLAEKKPHPAPITKALADMGCEAGRAVYVGDHEKDVIAGRAAGTRTIAVSWGYILPGQNPRNWSADYTIDRPEQLLELAANP